KNAFILGLGLCRHRSLPRSLFPAPGWGEDKSAVVRPVEITDRYSFRELLSYAEVIQAALTYLKIESNRSGRRVREFEKLFLDAVTQRIFYLDILWPIEFETLKH